MPLFITWSDVLSSSTTPSARSAPRPGLTDGMASAVCYTIRDLIRKNNYADEAILQRVETSLFAWTGRSLPFLNC